MSNFYLYFDHSISNTFLAYNVGYIDPTASGGLGLWYQAPAGFISPYMHTCTRNPVTGVMTLILNVPSR